MAGKTDGSSTDHHHDSARRDRERRRRGSIASEFCEGACRTRNQNPDGTSGAGINWERVDGDMRLRLVSYLIQAIALPHLVAQGHSSLASLRGYTGLVNPKQSTSSHAAHR